MSSRAIEQSSRVDALIEGADRSSRRPHTSRDVAGLGAVDAGSDIESAMADALWDILRDEARRDASRRG